MKLEVYWIPQVPMKKFRIPVDSPQEACKILDVLAAYDLFQYENNIKGDYCNMGGMLQFDPDDDHDSPDGSWSDWYSEDGETLDEWRENQEFQKVYEDHWSIMRGS